MCPPVLVLMQGDDRKWVEAGPGGYVVYRVLMYPTQDDNERKIVPLRFLA